MTIDEAIEARRQSKTVAYIHDRKVTGYIKYVFTNGSVIVVWDSGVRELFPADLLVLLETLP